ncbi:ribose transport system substrate-binding protein [Amaricoccus macauensis]|uniref:Ribose transport system substrate-binding protein n=1 Tax=Amaricoccus macauensis TaxID=57001 RepID=A0A840STV9_9RHOB|nr:sugar ABC transporter substrate-binding protein [Amaricoccus macauensis]MBB5223266.1 ribose transport system substrate-binding protein [Amaricoccus macauensis]
MKGFLSATALALAFAGAAQAQTVGVTVARFDSTFLTLVRDGIEAKAKELGDGVKLQIEDAVNDPTRQLDQVQNFIASGVDAIIVVAVDGEGTPMMTKAATDAGIPIVYINHPPADAATLPATAAFIGSDEKQSGTMQTEEVCRLLGGKGQAFVLMGPLNNSSASVRTQDIKDVLAKPECAGISIIDTQVANWDRLEAVDIMTNWLSSGQKFDAVIANNDEMAIGAIQAMQGVGTDFSTIIVAGIDATPDGLAAMDRGELDVTVFQDAHGQGAAGLATAVDLAKGKPLEQNIWIPFQLVTPENMEEYQTTN